MVRENPLLLQRQTPETHLGHAHLVSFGQELHDRTVTIVSPRGIRAMFCQNFKRKRIIPPRSMEQETKLGGKLKLI